MGAENKITRKTCLAACEDQVNLVTETSSSFPNSETFHRREEFCLIVNKLLRTCSTKKSAALTDKFPYICQHLSLIQNKERKDICPLGKWNPSVDHPELMVNSTQDTTKSVAELIRTEMFQYAKSNMALVNVYIKVSNRKTFKISWLKKPSGRLGRRVSCIERIDWTPECAHITFTHSYTKKSLSSID